MKKHSVGSQAKCGTCGRRSAPDVPVQPFTRTNKYKTFTPKEVPVDEILFSNVLLTACFPVILLLQILLWSTCNGSEGRFVIYDWLRLRVIPNTKHELWFLAPFDVNTRLPQPLSFRDGWIAVANLRTNADLNLQMRTYRICSRIAQMRQL